MPVLTYLLTRGLALLGVAALIFLLLATVAYLLQDVVQAVFLAALLLVMAVLNAGSASRRDARG
jgi:hypothetical protein